MPRFIALLCCVLVCVGCKTLAPQEREDLTLVQQNSIFFSQESLDESLAYQLYQNEYKNDEAYIRFLMNRVQYSEYDFYRNGKRYSGENAYRWLEYKYNKFYYQVETVEDFITEIASYSRTSGRDYYVETPENICVPMGLILNNELRRLRDYEEKLQSLRDMPLPVNIKNLPDQTPFGKASLTSQGVDVAVK